MIGNTMTAEAIAIAFLTFAVGAFAGVVGGYFMGMADEMELNRKRDEWHSRPQVKREDMPWSVDTTNFDATNN